MCEAHSHSIYECMGVGLNDIYERYRLLWLSGTKKKRTDGSGLVFSEMCIHFGAVKVVHSKSSDKLESSLTLRVALNNSWHRLI